MSKCKFIQKCTTHTNFRDDTLVNSKIKIGKGRNIIGYLHINVSELKNIFVESYNIEDTVVDRLQFSHESNIGEKGNSKIVSIKDDGSYLDAYKI